jgi:dienelactone hydrolase
VKTKEIEYSQDGTTLQGYLAWNDALQGRQPGVIVVHEWWGHNAHARRAAEKLAAAGYVAFALDMYGKGKVTTHPADAQAFMQEATRDPAVVAARFHAARAQLVADPHVDPERIGAIGYCMGGAVVLGMARQGEDLDAVATFHGAIGAEQPAEKGKFKPRVLVMTGADDPMVTRDVVTAFEKEMKAAGVKHQVITYPGAKHGFTNPDADKAGMPALAYNADADRKSWDAMLKMFREVFKK